MLTGMRVEFLVGDRTWAVLLNNKTRACGVIQNVGRLEQKHYDEGSQEWICLMNATPLEVVEFLEGKDIDTTDIESLVKMFSRD